MAARSKTAPRVPLSRERVLSTAVALADAGGVEAVTMRKLAEALGVEAMSLYHHVANKDEVLDGIAEAVVDEINLAVEDVDAAAAGGWQPALRERVLRARQALLAHPWAPEVIASRRAMGPAVLRYFDSFAGVMRAGGLSVDLVHHAMHALGSRALGFSQELFDAEAGGAIEQELSPEVLEQMAGAYPHIAEVASLAAAHDPDSTIGWCDDQAEFEFGLDLILDGLARLRDRGTLARDAVPPGADVDGGGVSGR